MPIDRRDQFVLGLSERAVEPLDELPQVLRCVRFAARDHPRVECVAVHAGERGGRVDTVSAFDGADDLVSDVEREGGWSASRYSVHVFFFFSRHVGKSVSHGCG